MGERDHDQEWHTVKGRHTQHRENKQSRLDIFTAKNFNKNHNLNLTTFFFTAIPDNFGARAMFNAFVHYGDIKEVVIPAKKDKGDQRFGFARFASVKDPHNFEVELDAIIIGRDKISVNLSRYQRPDRNTHKSDGNAGSKADMNSGPSSSSLNHNQGTRNGFNSHQAQLTKYQGGRSDSYARVAMQNTIQNSVSHKVAFSFTADEKDFSRFKRAFTGIVNQAGTTYHIQNAFHAQGYFGIKVTPLGPNLTLLEDVEDGEIESLLDEAGEWLHQRFKEIRPWNPSDVDAERLVWLRVYGIPIHAWNDRFFTEIAKPWGNFLNADEATTNSLTMDVARILVRTSCQLPVDDFFDVNINDAIFHIRVIEDHFGPYRMAMHQNRSVRTGSSTERDEEEEDFDHQSGAAEAEERDSEGVGENLLALRFIHAKNCSNADLLQGREVVLGNMVEESNDLSANNLNGCFNSHHNSLSKDEAGSKDQESCLQKTPSEEAFVIEQEIEQ